MYHLSRRIAIGGASLMIGAGIVAGATAPSFAATPAAAQVSPSPSAKTATKPHHHHRPAYGTLVDLTATQTGLTDAQVRAELRQGKSLNDIAGAKAGAVEQAALSALQSRLDKAVAGGKLTTTREAQMLARARTVLDKLMARHHVAKAPSTATPKPTP